MKRRRKVRNSLKIISTSWIDGKVGIYGEVVKEGECPFLTLGACAARVTVVVLSVCVCVWVCVDAYSGTTGYEVANERYQRLQNYANL